jgi:HEAT repeat protein
MMDLKYICIILCILVLPAVGQNSPQAGTGQSIPAWLENINPADYMLLAKDLSSPFQMDGDISAQAEAQELTQDTEKGSGAQKVQTFTARQKIATSKEGCPTTSIDVVVEVFESPEIAASARHIGGVARKGEGEKEWWNPSAFSDNRLGNGAGEASALFANVEWMVFVNSEGKWKEGDALQELQIRYKNIVASFYPTMYTGGVQDFDQYGGGDTCGLTDQIARQWLDKVSGIEPLPQSDLQIVPGNIFLSYFKDNYILPLEDAADKQQVVVQIDNVGDAVAKNVHLQLYVLASGEEDYQAIGDPVLVGEIAPGEETAGTVVWDLQGENIEDTTLLAQAFIPGENDSHPDDNSAAIKVNIYYAKNREGAYNPAQDGYSFKNFNLSEIETEELVEGMLTTVIGSLQPEQIKEISRAMQVRKSISTGMATVTGAGGGMLSGEQALLERTIFAPTYVLIDNYLNKMMTAGSGGHCYGMSATSSLYFQEPDRKPLDKPVSKMTQKEATPGIYAYVRTWYLPLYAALQTDALSPKLNRGVLATHQALKSSLKDERKPLIIEFYGTKNGNATGHAVLGYKLIEVEGEEPTIYVYDPNFPASSVKPPHPMPQIDLIIKDKNWANPEFMGYEWASSNRISATKAHSEISLEDTNALVPGLKKSISQLAGALYSLKKALVVVHCPADALFTDSQGRSTGMENGRLINEIPGAEVLASGEVEAYQLPLDESYQIAISGTGSGELDLDIITPVNETGLDLISFQKIAINKGSKVTGELQTDAAIAALQSGSKEISSTLEGSIDAGSTEPSASSQDGKETQPAGEDEETGNEPGTLDPVEEAIIDLQDPDADVRANAASALGWIKDKSAVDALIEKLRDEDPVVRSIVAVSLGVINDTRAAKPLISALDDENSSVRANAAVSLGAYLKDPSALEPLIRGLADKESIVRSSSAYALGELGDDKAATALTQAQKDEDETVKEEATAALEKLGKKSDQPQQSSSSIPQFIPASISIFSAQKIDEQKGGTSSPDGTKISYLQRIDSEERYVVAGPQGRINGSFYQNVRDFVFSPDGEHYAYKALVGDKRMAVVDGIDGQKYDEIYKIVFSQDGGRYAYMADKAGQVVVVVDGREEGPYESTTGDPIVSFAGQHVLYTIVKEGRNHVVVDGEVQEQVGYDPVVSPDGSRWAYSRSASYVGDPCYIVLDGEVMDLGNDNRVAQMVFSPDGERFAYDLVPGGGAYGDHVVTIDSSRGKQYLFPGVGKIVFSSDGSRTAYWAKAQGEGFVMVLDGVEGKTYDEISDPVFSPDDAHLAYTAKDKDGKFAVLDGEEGTRYVDLWGLTFDANSRLAYVARDNREGKDVRLVVVDGKEDRPYLYDWYGQGIRSGPVFSPDGKHIAYIANDGGRAEYVAIDEIRHLNPWTFLGGLSWGEGSPMVFDSADRFHYLAENDTGTYLINVNIPDVLASPDQCSWAGIWDTSTGLLDLQEKDGIVEGVYTVDWGAIRGKAYGDRLTGKWFDAPTRSEPNDAGDFEFILSEDCQNFSGNWRYGTSEGWSGEWTGKRAT